MSLNRRSIGDRSDLKRRAKAEEQDMLRSVNHIRTSHAGNLPPLGGAKVTHFASSIQKDTEATAPQDPSTLTAQVAALINKQREIGIDCVGDGEFWNGRGFLYYGDQFDGITIRDLRAGERGSGREAIRERDDFPMLYGDMDRAGTLFCVPGETARYYPAKARMVVTGPIKGGATPAVLNEIAVLKDAMKNAGSCDEVFICAPGPGYLSNFVFDEHYGDEERFLHALGQALRDDYRAIVNAGFILQIDDPGLITAWDMIRPAPTLHDYRRSLQFRVDAINEALVDIPEDKTRLHICWGSWHGAHTHDLPLKEVLDLILQVRTQGISFEAGNVRHEHEWTVWRDIKIPDGKVLMPGVISHATNLVEHPELVAQRIKNFAGIAGRENVIAGSDCGLGARVHDEIVWAKLATLVAGASLASQALWQK
jgi:5-methyltetrahydropteroyltriglutamate--homocysteine methyltransferase